MKRILLLLACSLWPAIAKYNGGLFAQKYVRSSLDSMKAELKKVDDDSTKMELLLSISGLNERINTEEGLKYGAEALKLAKKMKHPGAIASAYNRLGNNYRLGSDFGKAYEHYIKALKICRQTDNKVLRTMILTNIMHVYLEQGQLDKAEDYGRQALHIAEEEGDKENIATCYTNMGILFWKKEDYEAMRDYFLRSLEIYRELDDKLNIGISVNNVSAAYGILEDYPKALEYAKEAYEISELLGDKFNIASSLDNIGRVYLMLGNYKKALEYYSRSLAMNIELGNTKGVYNSYQNLAETYSKTGNYKRAFESMEKEILYKDSLMKKVNSEEIARLELNAEFEKQKLADSLKNAEARRASAARLQRQRMFTFSGIGVAAVLMALTFFIARERKRSDRLLLNILPAEVAKELKQKGASDARMFHNVTVLFTDFVGFTKVSEILTPKELVDELDACFKAFDGIIEKYGIEKIKTIGDAYLAVCGLPIADAQHAEKVINAAKEIVAFMQQRRQLVGDRTFEIRIGVHSGDVVAGIVGIKKFAYDIWGDTVNTAARMEQNSLPGRINISQDTYELVGDKFVCTYRGEIEAKNKGALNMYFVEGSK